MTPAYRRRRRRTRGVLRHVVIWTLRVGGVTIVLVVLLVVGLRFVDPPTSAFMLGERAAGMWSEEPPPLRQAWVDGACIATGLKLAVIAAEDQKFASHWGFDVAQIADALEAAEQGGRLRGASTISQQTAKNLFLWSGQSWLRKGLEAGLTLLIETFWPKQRILEIYLNIAEFGPGIYGAEAAARYYFDKPAAALSAAESALLAGVLPSPRRLRAEAPSAYLRERQHWILRHMSSVRGLPGMASLLAEEGACERV